MGFAIFDRLERPLPAGFSIPARCWQRREIENYFSSRDVLMLYAAGMDPQDLVDLALRVQREDAMRQAINQIEGNFKGLDEDPWSADFKVSDKFLPLVFKRYFENLGSDNRLNTSDFHILVDYIRPGEIDPEVVQVVSLRRVPP